MIERGGRPTPAARRRVAGRGWIAILGVSGALGTSPAGAAGPPVVVVGDAGVDAGLARRIATVVDGRRSVRPLRALPAPAADPSEIADEQRVAAVAAALERARRHEENAAWDECAKEAGDRLGDATELLASAGRLDLLRELHVQIGSCMSLGPSRSSAHAHFASATLLDETPPRRGEHRQEAETAHARARAEVLERLHGPVRIESEPPGAQIWIDGRRIEGTTPLAAPVRLGTHFVTARRFRHEPATQHVLLQPATTVRITLEPARPPTLRRQLGDARAGRLAVSTAEMRLAQAVWSGAEQLVVVSPVLPAREPGARVTLQDAVTGRALGTREVGAALDDDAVRDEVCAVLGETCAPAAQGIPWYVWPIAGVAVAGAAVAAGFIIDGARATRFCPSSGCD
jgi:hypothetical protein